MKNFTRTIVCKVTCFILCIAFLCITAACIAGAAFMIAGEFYVFPKEYVIDHMYESMLRNDSNNILWHHLDGEHHHYYSINDYDAQSTSIRYNVVSQEGEIVGSNSELKSFDFSFKWIIYKDEEGNFQEIDYYFEGNEIKENADVYTVNMSVDTKSHVNDQFFFCKLLVDIAYALLYWVYPIGIVSLIFSIVCFIILMSASARRPDSDGLHPGIFNKVPIDLFISLLVVGMFILFCLVWDVWYTGELLAIILTGVLIAVSVNILLGLCMSIAARIKQRTLFSNTLVWIVLKLIGRIFKALYKATAFLIRSIPSIWKTVLFVIGNTTVDFLLVLLAYDLDEAAIILWILKTILILPLIIYGAIMLRQLEKGGKAIAKGDLSYKVNTKGMFWDLKRHGENLNSISGGMANAVEERLQSERMKTELITNVSHDIKTPLTSIINYSSLISKESCSCEKHLEYSEVLVRKSEHLKRLLDDLVEISKATTGNLDVILSPCEAGVLIQQVAGEFSERCSANNLDLITSVPENDMYIMADSRRIWRVFENLMSNACKYSLSGSRVYLTLEEAGSFLIFTVRNTSSDALNISADELTQRFVRGDSSRTTEGSGLGLSIAKSLTELQGGNMNITIDGDLFKVTLTFPKK